MAKKAKDTKEVKKFRWKFTLMVLIVDAIAVVLMYFIMPLVQNFPPLCIPKRRTSLNTYTTIHSSIYIRNINTPIFIFNTNEKHLQILKQILPKRKNRI